jgi:menaquinone-dependent protoporphyrinogen IX oxidase
MNGIVIYQSRYGAAKQYAEWIAEALNIPAQSTDQINKARLATCDYVIAGSSIYIGKILIKDWLAKNSDALQGKKLFLFIVGGAPPTEKEKTEKYFKDNISIELLDNSSHFYLQGKTIFKQLNFSDKILLRMGAMFAKGADKKEMLTDLDALRKENLEELLAEVRKLEAPKAGAGKSLIYHPT